MGRSLGSAVAMRVASANPIARQELVTPLESTEELADEGHDTVQSNPRYCAPLAGAE